MAAQAAVMKTNTPSPENLLHAFVMKSMNKSNEALRPAFRQGLFSCLPRISDGRTL